MAFVNLRFVTPGEEITDESVNRQTRALAELVNGNLKSDNLTEEAVATKNLASESVTRAKVADGAIGGTELADEAVDTEKLADKAVSADKIDFSTFKTKYVFESQQRAVPDQLQAFMSVNVSDIPDGSLIKISGLVHCAGDNVNTALILSLDGQTFSQTTSWGRTASALIVRKKVAADTTITLYVRKDNPTSSLIAYARCLIVEVVG